MTSKINITYDVSISARTSWSVPWIGMCDGWLARISGVLTISKETHCEKFSSPPGWIVMRRPRRMLHAPNMVPESWNCSCRSSVDYRTNQRCPLVVLKSWRCDCKRVVALTQRRNSLPQGGNDTLLPGMGPFSSTNDRDPGITV